MSDLFSIAIECRERAGQLRRDATGVTYAPARASILDLANTWDRLAEEAERDLRWRDWSLPPSKPYGPRDS